MDRKSWQLWSIGLQGVGHKWSGWAYILERNSTEQHVNIIPSLWSEQTGFLLISHAQFTISHFMWMTNRPSKTTTQKRCSFHYRGLECKSKKSRDNLKNWQIWPWSTKWSGGKANRVLPREHTGHRKYPLPKHKKNKDYTHEYHKMVNTMVNGQYEIRLSSLQLRIEKLYIISKNKTGSWLWLRSWTPYCQIQT